MQHTAMISSMKLTEKILISTSKPMNVSKKLRFKLHKFEKKLKAFAQHLTLLWKLSKPSNNKSLLLSTTARLLNDRQPKPSLTFETVFLARTSDMTHPSSFKPTPLLLVQELSIKNSFNKSFHSFLRNRRFLERRTVTKYLVVFITKTQNDSILRIDPDRNIGTISVANAISTVISSGTAPSTNAFNVARTVDTNWALVKVKRNLIQSLLPPLKNTTQRNEKTNDNDKPPLLQSD